MSGSIRKPHELRHLLTFRRSACFLVGWTSWSNTKFTRYFVFAQLCSGKSNLEPWMRWMNNELEMENGRTVMPNELATLFLLFRTSPSLFSSFAMVSVTQTCTQVSASRENKTCFTKLVGNFLYPHACGRILSGGLNDAVYLIIVTLFPLNPVEFRWVYTGAEWISRDPNSSLCLPGRNEID